jgi:predicted amidohydrolase YtcJ
MGFGLCIGTIAERRLPRASELDSWLPGRKVIIISMDGHSSSYSSLALAELGLASVAEDGILQGEAHEFNMGRVSAYAMGSLGLGAILRGLSEATAEAIDGGLASIHCLEGTEDSATDEAIRIMAIAGPRLPLRLRLWLQYTEMSRAARYANLLERRRVGGCLAWEMDGSISSRSAAMDEPYLDKPHAGRLYRMPEEAYALIAPFCEAGWQTTAHAIGPRGIESILSAYERVLDEAGDGSNARRLRIDHFEFPRPDQVERAGKRRIVLAVQPGFAWLDERLIHGYDEALPPSVKRAQCPLRDLIDSGCVVALSTDAPVQPLNPFIQIAGAVEHPNPAQGISVYEALRAYSWAGAYSTFEEGERGSLAVGKYADFAVLDRDPFRVPNSELASLRVLGTWIEGERVGAPSTNAAIFALKLLASGRRKL